MAATQELYSPALHLQMFFIHVKRLVKTAGVETFTLQDLTRPEASRVRDCFSAVINFAKFKCVPVALAPWSVVVESPEFADLPRASFDSNARLSHSGLYEELVAKGDEINLRRSDLAEEAQRISFQLEQLKCVPTPLRTLPAEIDSQLRRLFLALLTENNRRRTYRGSRRPRPGMRRSFGSWAISRGSKRR